MGNIIYILTAVILSKKNNFNQTPSCMCSMCLYCIGKYQIDPSKTVVGVDENEGTIYAYTKALLGTNYLLSSHSCHFVKNKF